MSNALKHWLGASLCTSTALLLSAFLRDSTNVRFVAPIICLQMVVLVSLLCGRLSGLIGALVATLVFAFFLFPPVGHFAISDSMEVLMLLLFLLCTACVFCLMPHRSNRDSG